MAPSTPMLRIVVMGVAGCGKTTIGQRLAERLNCRFVEGDDFHPAGNVIKMASGEPLTDHDRAPWLASLRAQMIDCTEPIVLACSALKRGYRDVLSDNRNLPVVFVHLSAGFDTVERQIAHRSGHFMPSALLQSQFDTLEPLSSDENGFEIGLDQSPDQLVETILRRLDSQKWA